MNPKRDEGTDRICGKRGSERCTGQRNEEKQEWENA